MDDNELRYQRAMATTGLRLHDHATWRARLAGLSPEQIALEVYRSFTHTTAFARTDCGNLQRVIEVVIELAKEPQPGDRHRSTSRRIGQR